MPPLCIVAELLNGMARIASCMAFIICHKGRRSSSMYMKGGRPLVIVSVVAFNGWLHFCAAAIGHPPSQASPHVRPCFMMFSLLHSRHGERDAILLRPRCTMGKSDSKSGSFLFQYRSSNQRPGFQLTYASKTLAHDPALSMS